MPTCLNLRLLAGAICAAGLMVAWFARRHERHRARRRRRRTAWISEILAAGSRAASIVKVAFISGALVFSVEGAFEISSGRSRGYIAIVAAAALIATSLIDLRAIYTDSTSRSSTSSGVAKQELLHPLAAAAFFVAVSAYLLAGTMDAGSPLAMMTLGCHVLSFGWLVAAVQYAAWRSFRSLHPVAVLAVLLDTRTDSAAEPARAAEWRATIAICLAVALGP